MRFSSSLLKLLTGLACLPLGAAMASPAEAVPKILGRLVEDNEGFGGGVVRVSDGNGLVIESAAGMARPGVAMTPETPFEIASVTKAVTAATVLRLVESGKLRLDDQLKDLLPSKEALGFDPNITIRQLLSHSSGLRHYWTTKPKDRGRSFLQDFMADPGHDWSPGEILAHARRLPAKAPGSLFEYSDTNYVLLGRIIEHATGESLHSVYRRLIFNPLGMSSTWLTYREPQRGDKLSDRYEGEENLTGVARQSADWAGGGLASTTKDLERFLRGLAGGLFQSPNSWSIMRESLPTGTPDISYGLGLYRIQLDDGMGELWGHDGHGNSFAYYWPQRGITFTGTLNQTENDWWPLVEAFIEGDVEGVSIEETEELFGYAISTGWDSLYMDRGVNSLPGEGGYGSGIQWVDVSLAYAFGNDDYLLLDVWQAFSTGETTYREVSPTLTYVRSFGDLELSAHYSFTYGYGDSDIYSNELGVSAGWAIEVGDVTIVPSVNYLFNLGPDSDAGYGIAKAASSFLAFRVDANCPLPWSFVSLEPWVGFGINFGYTTRGEDATAFHGANNIETGLAVPFQITSDLTLSVYGAYSHALTDLTGTSSNTFWGGASLGLEF